MSKIKLPSVTLCCLTGLNYKTEEHLEAIKKSCEGIEFGNVKLIQQGDIIDVDTWNKAVIYDLWKYVDTAFAMFIHHDGGILNPESWQDSWLQYDWCSSPWPLPTDHYSYRTPKGDLIRVGNSVSLRSKKLMQLIATRPMEYHYGNNSEDGQICVWERDWLEEQGCKFMPFGESVYFGIENELPEHKGIKPFVYHSL